MHLCLTKHKCHWGKSSDCCISFLVAVFTEGEEPGHHPTGLQCTHFTLVWTCAVRFAIVSRLLLCTQAVEMTSSSVDSTPPRPLHCCSHAAHRHKQAHHWKCPATTQTEKQPARSPFSTQTWSYFRSTCSGVQSPLLVFNVLVATMVTVLICPSGSSSAAWNNAAASVRGRLGHHSTKDRRWTLQTITDVSLNMKTDTQPPPPNKHKSTPLTGL